MLILKKNASKIMGNIGHLVLGQNPGAQTVPLNTWLMMLMDGYSPSHMVIS